MVYWSENVRGKYEKSNYNGRNQLYWAASSK